MEHKWMAITAGILDIVAGSLRALGTLVAAIVVATMAALGRNELPYAEDFPIAITASILITLAIFLLIISILAIVGGAYAVRRKNWGMALAGSIAALLCATPLGIAAIVLIALSKKEFE